MKKLTLFFLCLLSVLNISAEVYSGSCGDNASYTLDTETGLLSITGTGAMTDYSTSGSVPWYSKRSYIKTVEIAYDITSIGQYAFYGCYGISRIIIPNGATYIGSNAFNGCSGLTTLGIPTSVTYVGVDAFSGTAWYNNLADGLVYAGKALYKYKGTMPNNTSISLKNGTVSIAEKAFYGCSGLTSIKNFTSVTSIGSQAFSGCSGLKTLTIPDKVTNIGASAFAGCSSLTSITIPDNVTTIGASTFSGCSGLTSVTIGSGVTSIGSQAFYGCNSLAEVYCLAVEVPTTNSNVFDNTNIAQDTLYVPEASFSVYKTAIPWSAFGTIRAIAEEKPENLKCATPTISFEDGVLTFGCETEGVILHYEYIYPQGGNGIGNQAAVSQTLTVTVYAAKYGYKNSDVVTEEIYLGGSGGIVGIKGDVNEDGEVNVGDIVTVTNIMAGN